MVHRRRLWRAQNQDIRVKSKSNSSEFIVSGLTGEYRVNINEPSCSCPDWTKRKPEDGCKHILRIKLNNGSIDPLPSANTNYSRTSDSNRSYPQNWHSLRNQTLERDNWECQKCGAKGGNYGNKSLHVHHIIPKSKGGDDEVDNLISLCKDCHESQHGHHIPTNNKFVNLSKTNDNRYRGNYNQTKSHGCDHVEPHDWYAFDRSPQAYWHFVAISKIYPLNCRKSKRGDQGNMSNQPSRPPSGQYELRHGGTAEMNQTSATDGKNLTQLSGSIAKIKNDSGLIKRCSVDDCSRLLKESQCSEHGDGNGEFDLQINAIVDYQESEQDVIFGRDATEQMTGISLDDAKQMAKDALDTSVVIEEIRANILGERYQVGGIVIDGELHVKEFTQVDITVFTGTVVQAGSPVILDNGSESRQVETDAAVRLGEEITVRGIERDKVIYANEIR